MQSIATLLGTSLASILLIYWIKSARSARIKAGENKMSENETFPKTLYRVYDDILVGVGDVNEEDFADWKDEGMKPEAIADPGTRAQYLKFLEG